MASSNELARVSRSVQPRCTEHETAEQVEAHEACARCRGRNLRRVPDEAGDLADQSWSGRRRGLARLDRKQEPEFLRDQCMVESTNSADRRSTAVGSAVATTGPRPGRREAHLARPRQAPLSLRCRCGFGRSFRLQVLTRRSGNATSQYDEIRSRILQRCTKHTSIVAFSHRFDSSNCPCAESSTGAPTTSALA